MRREIFGARSPEALTRARIERKLLLGEEEALALEIAVADRLALKLFPCGETTRIVTLYLDRPDGLLVRHALEGRGAHLRVRVKGFFPAPSAPGSNGLPASLVVPVDPPAPAMHAVVSENQASPEPRGGNGSAVTGALAGDPALRSSGPGGIPERRGAGRHAGAPVSTEGQGPRGSDRSPDPAGSGDHVSVRKSNHGSRRIGPASTRADAIPPADGNHALRPNGSPRPPDADGFAGAASLVEDPGRGGGRRPVPGNGVPGGDPAAPASLAPVPTTPGLAVEVKRRRGGLTRKERTWCLPAELPALLAGEDPRARRLGLHRIAPGARAVCLVGYLRRVYEESSGTLRVTIDRQLGTAEAGPAELARLVAGLPPEVPPAPDAPVVTEVKHLGPLPGWIAGTVARAEAPFSKLVWALVKRGGR
jgi:hypothetical protein